MEPEDKLYKLLVIVSGKPNPLALPIELFFKRNTEALIYTRTDGVCLCGSATKFLFMLII